MKNVDILYRLKSLRNETPEMWQNERRWVYIEDGDTLRKHSVFVE